MSCHTRGPWHWLQSLHAVSPLEPNNRFELKRFEEAQPEPEAGSAKALPGGTGMKRHSLSQAMGSDLKKKSRLEGSRGKGASPLSAGPIEKEVSLRWAHHVHRLSK